MTRIEFKRMSRDYRDGKRHVAANRTSSKGVTHSVERLKSDLPALYALHRKGERPALWAFQLAKAAQEVMQAWD